MKFGLRVPSLAVALLLGAAPTLVSFDLAGAEPATKEEVSRAQVEMIKRVIAAADAYADSIGVPLDYAIYCHTKLNAFEEDRPQNGSMPFGMNYNNMSSELLRQTIQNRETFERAYLTLCIAKAKNTLRAAAH